ncbi:MAG TPA: AAA family ATPase, partial [Anaerolineae bacterium]|nr:AAA family ATPase [Anaerolineae bacterium]
MLGRFEVACEEHILCADGWTRRKAAALLQRLALERRLVKDQAIDFLWPDASLAGGANNLYRTLYALRQALDTALGAGTANAMLSFEGGVLSLEPAVWVDVHEFERLCATPSSAPPGQRAAALQRALELYEGDLLPDDRYAEWTLRTREVLYRRQRDARLALAVNRRDAGDHAAAIALLTPLLASGGDPADEPVHRELMRLYALAGQRHEAMRQYQACVEALAAELDVTPEPETVTLYSQILAGDLSPPAAPWRPLWAPSPPAGLEVEEAAPATAASRLPSGEARPLFVGRDRELAVLQSHLQAVLAGNGRILLITGEAGQGKTSLMARFSDLAQAEHPDLVVAAAACQSIAGLGDPYLPFRDLLAMLHGDWQRPWLGGSMGPGHSRRLQAIAPLTARALAAYAPDLADVILPAALRSTPSGSPSRHLNQRQILDQMRQLLHVLAQRQPLVLLLDDLQWADTASTSLLFHLGRQLLNSAVLIVGAYRPSEVSPTSGSEHPLAAVVQELVRYRGDILIDLDNLVPAEGRRFVDALLDSEPN